MVLVKRNISVRWRSEQAGTSQESRPMVKAAVSISPRTRAAPPRSASLSVAAARIPRLQRASLEDQAYASLRAAIVDRRILPGQRIPVDQLARDLGISRTPILNALKRLAQERVVDCLSRRGIYVRRFSKREMARLFEVREALEGMAVRLAATRITPAEVRSLQALFRGLAGLPPARLIRRYIEHDRRFHSRLVEAAGNSHLMAALDSVNMMFFAYQDGLVRPPAETIPEHHAILEALGRRDASASEAAMRVHIRRSIERLESEAAAEESDDGEERAQAQRRGGKGPGGLSDGSSSGRHSTTRGGTHHGTTTR
jgi:DNA-binding GntR family transcriptional regulator